MNFKLPFLKQFDAKTSAEQGRSMVEILGVLAVIGVLSAGGIYGYSFAMDKYRANDIIYEVNLRNRDTWHKYQDKDLPEADELDEWADTTQTGFPIGVYPRSNIVFDVQVDDVPSRVCKQVLNMNIEGPMFIWTPAEDGKKQIFNGNASELCGNDIETSIVFTTSLDSYGQDEGLRQGATDENGRPLRYCLDDDDCFSCQTCDVGTYTCQSTCPDATPICHSTLQQCVACEDNSDCANNQICSEYNEETGESQVCVTVEETCAEGEFRSQNGACIPCDYPANVLIKSDETFMNDTGTGKELCLACPNSRRVEGNGEKIYCSKYCTNGFSFADTSTTCQACTNEKGFWKFVNTPENQQKCLDCSPIYYLFHTSDTSVCSNINTCSSDEYFYPTPQGICYKCNHSANMNKIYLNLALGFAGRTVPDRKTSCESCPDTPTTKRWWVQYGTSNWHMACFPVCEQPSDAPDTCEEKTAQTCNRKFQGVDTKCYSCNEPNKINIGFDSGLQKLCTDCKREVNGEYCVLKETCTDTQFRGMDGKCYDCSETNWVRVLDENDSKCATNCRAYQTGNYTGREIVNGYSDNGQSKRAYICRLKCNDTDSNGNRLFQSADGQCVRCDAEQDVKMNYTYLSQWGYFYLNKSEYNAVECHTCNTKDANGNIIKVREAYDYACKLYKSCDGFVDSKGTCYPCTTKGSTLYVTEDECKKCASTHLWMTGWSGGSTFSSCIFVEPGVSGVCNNIGNGNFSDYDDSSKKMFRDYMGICRDCNSPDQIFIGHPTSGNHNRGTAQQQCAHCQNRNYDEYRACNPGLCSDGTTFVNNRYACVQCSTTTARTEIPLGVATEDNCTSCDGKRVMKTGSTDDKNLKAYCVKKCVVGEFQKTDGKCYTGSNDYGTIGSDEQSKTLCRESGRIAFSKQNNGVTDWYCSQTATETEHFINLSGQRVSCTANDTEIPNSQDARNLCTQCSDRYIETTGDKITCRKG